MKRNDRVCSTEPLEGRVCSEGTQCGMGESGAMVGRSLCKWREWNEGLEGGREAGKISCEAVSEKVL